MEKEAFALYIAFYILFAILFILSICSILRRCFLRGPTAIVLFSTNEGLTRGLEPSVIESFPKFPYNSEKSTDGDPSTKKMTGECVVCLATFEENETLRLLPKCGHVFHANCVDTWLLDHATCPFCRADMLLCDDCGRRGERPPMQMEIVVVAP